MKRVSDAFNPAFKDLHRKITNSQETVKQSEEEHSRRNEGQEDERQFFLEAMSDVDPLPEKKRRVARHPKGYMRPAHPAPDDEQEALAHLYDLVKGNIGMDITFSDEYMEGAVKGFRRKLMRQLKKGEFPVQDYTDLHGLTKQEARIRVREFLLQSHRLGLRCVLIVHGRGLNSPDSFPVLKERLPLWLSRGPMRKIVLAFCTARPYDGGTGAVYVLLRKR